MDEAKVMAAVSRFNEQLATLPVTVICMLDGIYPEFDNPEHSPAAYLELVEDEIRNVEAQLEEKADEHVQQLLAMLNECAAALREAGV